MELPSNIDGPVSLSIFHIKFEKDIDKLILLFGDTHTYPKYTCEPGEFQEGCSYEGCETIIDFLEETFKKSKSCIDFFLETDFLTPLLPKYEHPDIVMVNIKERFEDCFQRQNKKCLKYGNVRAHYSDLRTHINEKVLLYLFPGLEKEIKDLRKQFSEGQIEIVPDYFDIMNKYKRNLKTYDEHFRKTIMYITGLSDEEPPLEIPVKAKDIFNFHRRKIKKQWNALSKNVKEKIAEKIEDVVETYIKETEKIRRHWFEGFTDFTEKVDLDDIYRMLKFLLTLQVSIIMDVYLLLRALRKDLDDSNIAIVYAGNRHISSYSSFLEKTFDKPIFETKPPPKSKCIKIPENIKKKVQRITLNYPERRCSYGRRDLIQVLSFYFGKDRKTINSCLKQTSFVNNMSESNVLKILDKTLNIKGEFLPSSNKEICKLNDWSKSIQKYGFPAEIPKAELREDNSTGQKFVIKFFDPDEEDMSKEMWEGEVKAYQRTQRYKPEDSDIIDFYRYVECSEDLKMIFMENLGNVTLKEFIKTKVSQFSEKKKIKWWVNLLLTLAKNVSFLEKVRINHRDLHTSNIHVVNKKIKIFDFGLSVGAPLDSKKMFSEGWTLGKAYNFMGELISSEFLLGFDLHDFLGHFFISDVLVEYVPQKILKNLVFPHLKSLSEKEIQDLTDLNLDDPPFTKITFEGKTKTIPNNLVRSWIPTSGKKYYKTVLKYKKTLK